MIKNRFSSFSQNNSLVLSNLMTAIATIILNEDLVHY